MRGGLGNEVAALTINKVCGSGLKAVMLAAQGIAVGDTDVVVAGGMESMSNCPYLLSGAREGLRMGHGQVVDSMINDGLWCSFEDWHMGNAGEVVASDYGIDAKRQDALRARESSQGGRGHRRRAIRRRDPAGRPFRRRKATRSSFDRDESIRADTTMEALAALKPAFKTDGTVTAGNAPPVNDGAAALVVMSDRRAHELSVTPMARIVGQATSGLAPKYVLMTPVEAIRRARRRRLAGRSRMSICSRSTRRSLFS